MLEPTSGLEPLTCRLRIRGGDSLLTNPHILQRRTSTPRPERTSCSSFGTLTGHQPRTLPSPPLTRLIPVARLRSLCFIHCWIRLRASTSDRASKPLDDNSHIVSLRVDKLPWRSCLIFALARTRTVGR